MLNGKWIGEYTYLENYPKLIKGKSVAFELIAKSNGIEFEGYVTDDESRDVFNEPATIKGFWDNDIIHFTKLYPYCWVVYPNGEVEYLPEIESPEILYSGKLINDHFEGEWEIPFYNPDDGSLSSNIIGRGSWSMRKVLD